MRASSLHLLLVALLILAACLPACMMPYQLELRSAKSKGEKGDYQGAIEAYQKIINSNPKSLQATKAQLAIGEIYYEKLDQKQKALEIFQKILNENPNSDESNQVLWKLGTHFFKLDEYQKADESFNKLFVSSPHSELGINAQLMIAKCYEELKKFERAAQSYYAFALLHPDHPKSADSLLYSANIYSEKLKRSNNAIKVYQYLIKTYGNDRQASDIIMNAKSQLLALKAEVPNPDPEKLTTFEGRRQERRETRRERQKPLDPLKAAHEEAQPQNLNLFGYDGDELIREFQAAIPGGAPDTQGTMEDAAHMVANMYFQQEDYAKAGALYLKVIEKITNNASIYWSLGRCYEKLGFIEKAKESYKTAFSKDKNMIQDMIASVEKEYDLGNYEEAVSKYQSIIGVGTSEHDSLIYHRVGLTYLRLKDIQKALEAFESSVALKPTVSNQDSLQHVAELLQELGMPLKAAIYQDAADGKTNDFKVEGELGNLCYKYQSYDWARIKYRSASNLTKDQKLSIEMKVKAALSYAKKGMRDLAKNELSKLEAQAQAPDKASICYGLGVLAYDKGEYDEAIIEFNKALQYEPNYEEAKTALEEANKAKAEGGKDR